MRNLPPVPSIEVIARGIIPLTSHAFFHILKFTKREVLIRFYSPCTHKKVPIGSGSDKRGQIIGVEKKAGFFQNIRGDLSGAVSAAIITLPMSIGYGIVAFAALGPAYAPAAALTGIYCAVFTGFFASLLGGTSVLITGPKAPLTLVLASVVASLVSNPPLPGPVAGQISWIVSLAFLCVFMGGLFQMLFGMLRLGNIVKYIPYPVIAGFMNGIALLLIYKQMNPLLGLEGAPALFTDLSFLAGVKPLSMAVGLSTLAMVYVGRRLIKRVPASLVGLVAGTALYYLFWYLQGPAALGPVIGNIDVTIPRPVMMQGFIDVISSERFLYYLRILLLPAVILGVFGSIDSLLAAVVEDDLTAGNHRSNKELVGQGVGNMISSLFGGITGAGSAPRTVSNYQAGGRTILAGMASSVMILLIVMLFGRFVGMIPLASIAGIIIYVGIGLFDQWSLNLIKKVIKTAEYRSEVAGNLLVTLLVTVLTVVVNLVIAIVLGFGVAVAFFLSKMGRSVIHRTYSGRQVTSKKIRSVELSRLLHDHGRSITVFELYGPIFFGSAERLAREIEESSGEAQYFILDMKRVKEIDSTGARIINRMHRNLKDQGKHLLVSYLTERHASWASLVDMEVVATLGREHFFDDTDMALEWAEEHLLERTCCRMDGDRELRLEEFGLFKDFNEEELGILKGRLTKRSHRKGDIVSREGDPERDLLFLTRGAVSIGIGLTEGDRLKRLVTYSPGAVFGEVELLDGNSRSANAWAATDSEILHLTPDGLESLRMEHPGIAHKLIMGLARELSLRLRMANEELRLLEDF